MFQIAMAMPVHSVPYGVADHPRHAFGEPRPAFLFLRELLPARAVSE